MRVLEAPQHLQCVHLLQPGEGGDAGARRDAVADDDGDPSGVEAGGDVLEGRGDADGELGDGLPGGATPYVLTPAHGREQLGMALPHLRGAAALPLPHVDLPQPGVEAYGQPARLTDRGRGISRPLEVGGDDHLRSVCRESRGRAGRLVPPDVGQGRVAVPLPDAGRVVERLPVPDDDEPPRRGVAHGAGTTDRSTSGQSFQSRSSW